MAFIGTIGDNFIFQARFLDPATNDPVAVPDPVIRVFTFDEVTGDLEELVATTAMDPAVPSETGRYTYVFLLPDTLTDVTTIYAEMSGTDPGSGDPIRINQNLLARVDPASITIGLIGNFF